MLSVELVPLLLLTLVIVTSYAVTSKRSGTEANTATLSQKG
jgi:hypothetical protein